jgi:hypothetical protein
MNTKTLCLQYLAQFFSEREKFQTQVVQKIKIHISPHPHPRSRAVYDIMLKIMVVRQPKDDIIRPISFTCWISKATHTHSECVILIAFPRKRWLRERKLRYVTRGLLTTETDCLLRGTAWVYK